MTPFEWQVPFLVIVIVVAILYVSGRSNSESVGPPAEAEPTSGAELIDRLQRTLGMAIVVESIEPSEPSGSEEALESDAAGPPDAPHAIRATLMFGRYTARVVATGPTASDAWADLARMAIAWRNSDYQHIPMWGGGA
jgi:hypothetical protein